MPQDAVQIFDSMVILQQMTKIVLPTFGAISEYLINRILKDFSLTYFVTYQYLPGSVKSLHICCKLHQVTPQIQRSYPLGLLCLLVG